LIADNYKFFTILQGFPAAITLGGIDLTTTDELAITEFSPIVTPLEYRTIASNKYIIFYNHFSHFSLPIFPLIRNGR
jgi:hypothetical protein